MIRLEITKHYQTSRPAVKMPHPDLYSKLKEDGVRQMVSDHYELLRKSDIQHLFPENDTAFEKAKKHSADFFVQMLGGPKYYHENRGHPKLLDRHAPFKITPRARVTWLNCYKDVLSKLSIDDHLIQSFWDYLNVFSIWMVNAEDEDIVINFKLDSL